MSAAESVCWGLAWTMSGSALFLAIGGLVRRLRQSRLRRLSWLGAFVCVAGLPLLAFCIPARQNSSAAKSEFDPACVPDPREDVPYAAMALGFWGTGSAIMFGWTVFALAKVKRWSASATGFDARAAGIAHFPDLKVRVARENGPATPMICGFFRPMVLLPGAATTWDETRISAILWHELGHIVRRDHQAQLMALAVCALHWFNPLFWMARRRLEAESEMAADQYAIDRGVRPSHYASALLSIAAEFPSRTWGFPHAHTAMVKPCPLEERIRSILQAEPRPQKAAVFGQALIAGTMALLCAAFLTGIPALAGWFESQIPTAAPACETNHR